MADFTQTSIDTPPLQSDVLVGDDHAIVDRPFGENLDLSMFDLVSLDGVTNTWGAFDAADKGIGILGEDVITGAGGSKTAAVIQSGLVKHSKVALGAATSKVGEHLGMLIFM